MKCNSCSIEVSKEFKVALQKNMCPACGGKIIEANHLGQLPALIELLSEQHLGQAHLDGFDVEGLAVKIITTFDVLPKGQAKPALTVRGETKDAPAMVVDEDAEYKQKQMADAKSKLAQMREEAYKDAVREQWGMTPDGEEQLDPDIGEMLVNQVSGEDKPNAGEAYIERKQQTARARLLSGSGLIRRGS